MAAGWRFGRFELRPASRQLLRDEEPVALGARAFDLLLCLVERADRIVDRDELMHLVWPGTVVGDNNLNVQISTLRKVLGAPAVLTVAGRGYRFGHELQQLPASAPPSEGSAEALPQKPSVAVLPFLDLGADPLQAPLAEVLSEDVTTELARFGGLFVVARHSTFAYRDRALDVRALARELGVRYVVEGSVRHAGPKVRVVVQLVGASGGQHLWTERYDRVCGDPFELHDELSQCIVAAIAPQIEAAEHERVRRIPASDLGAYGLAQRAWALAAAGEPGADPARCSEALHWAEMALALDPQCALALRAVAAVHGWRAFYQAEAPAGDSTTLGLAAAERALALDPGDHEARRCRGLLLLLARRHDEALAELRRALATNRNCARTRIWLAWAEAVCGDAGLGVQQALEALRLSPRHPARDLFELIAAFVHLIAGDHAAAVRCAQAPLRNASAGPAARLAAALGHAGLGDVTRARAAFQALQQAAPRLADAMLAGQGPPLAAAGACARARALMHVAAGLGDAPASGPTVPPQP